MSWQADRVVALRLCGPVVDSRSDAKLSGCLDLLGSTTQSYGRGDRALVREL